MLRTRASSVSSAALLLAACASAPRSAAVAEAPAPTARVSDLLLTDTAGGVHDVAALTDSGRVVALVFWQTWCASCKQEAPDLVAAQRQHASRIEFLGVVPGPDTIVDDGEVAAVARGWGLSYPTVRDRDLSLARRFDVQGTPTIVVLGRGGRVLYHGHSAPEWSALSAPARP